MSLSGGVLQGLKKLRRCWDLARAIANFGKQKLYMNSQATVRHNQALTRLHFEAFRTSLPSVTFSSQEQGC